MANDTKQLMLFKDLSGKKVEADFQGGEVTSDAGLLFLRETERPIGLLERVASVLRDSRHPGYVKHQLVEMLRQRVFQIACGYEDSNDFDCLRDDPALKMACERRSETDSPLASQPTICRLENAISRTYIYRIAQVLLELFIDSYEEAPEAIILDIDDTDDETHGGQQLALFNAFHDGYCYMPIHIVKEHKTHLFSDRTSCSRFEANQFRLFLHSLAYVLLDTFRRLHLRSSEWAQAQFDTIRVKLLKIGARVKELGTKIKIHLPSSFLWKAALWSIWRSCRST